LQLINNEAQDLLAPRGVAAVKLRPGDTDKRDIFMGCCSEIPVATEGDLIDALARGHKRRGDSITQTPAPPPWKSHLPNSHAIFIIHVTQHGAVPPSNQPAIKDPVDPTARHEYMYRAQLMFVDLAHSATLRGSRGAAADALAALREAAAPPDTPRQVNVRHTEAGLNALQRCIDVILDSRDEAPFGSAHLNLMCT
jgi:hypothetical protein